MVLMLAMLACVYVCVCVCMYTGRKSGKGIFTYEGKGKGKRPINEEALTILKKYSVSPRTDHNDETVQNRLAARFVNEAVLCLQENILNSPVWCSVTCVYLSLISSCVRYLTLFNTI